MTVVIEWVVRQSSVLDNRGFVIQVAEPGANLHQRLHKALGDYPCDVLFIHRDAEKEPRERRLEEIRSALSDIGSSAFVPVVPVRMTEAWLLIDESAIRRAAGNPNGETPLALPKPSKLDSLVDPKSLLRESLILASEKSGRRLHQFKRDLTERTNRVAELIGDFSPLRHLPAFHAFEHDTREVLIQVLT